MAPIPDALILNVAVAAGVLGRPPRRSDHPGSAWFGRRIAGPDPARRRAPPPRPRIGRVGALGLVLLLVLAPAAGFAHGLRLFASADGAQIRGSAVFADGTPAAGMPIRIETRAGQVLGRTVADVRGAFHWAAGAPVEHRIIAEGIDGHGATWIVGADELRPGFVDAAPVADSASAPAVDPRLLAAVEQAVARQIAPLRAQLQAAAGRARLNDIIGGIGWIIALAGWGAWWLTRRRASSRS